MVTAALQRAAEPVPANALAAEVSAAFPERPTWQVERLVVWMEKHGLLTQTPT